MRILIDAMGGDNTPQAAVEGAVAAIKEFGVDITLVGREAEIRSCLDGLDTSGAKEHITIVNAEEVITMEDDPATATRRKKDSSMTVALEMLARGEGDACISAGSTGALLSGATLIVKRIHGIRRGCLAPVIPNGGKGALLIDCGANVECTPEYLLQFAYMGSFYSHEILGCESPKVGLLNIGTEEGKGTALQKETHALLCAAAEEGRLNYVGNAEAGDLFNGRVDVMVCDGFTGNVFLKSIEGTAKFLVGQFKTAFMKNLKTKLAALMMKDDIRVIKGLLDSSETGGTALLGISRPVIKTHGSSDARAFRSTVRQAIAFADSGIAASIEENIAYMRINNI